MIFSVSEANNFIKALLDAVPQLQTIFVRGEISNYKLYPSGHHYFTLKDEGSALKCVMFRGMAGKLRFRPENGMKVIAFGRIGVFPRDGAYQLYCSELSVEGVGDLHVAFEQLKEKLFKEGLFAPEHKKPLPKYPKRIAIITSSAGAAVHDMLRILNARWPMSEIVLLPVRVQGVEAPPEIAGALRYANKTGSRLFVPVAPLRSGPGRFTTERRHDLWIDKGYCDTDSLTLHLPEGYVVEALPKSVTIENRFGKIAFEALCSGDRLHIRIRLLRRSGRYPQSEYAAFREFMQAVDRVYSAKIVLRKV